MLVSRVCGSSQTRFPALFSYRSHQGVSIVSMFNERGVCRFIPAHLFRSLETVSFPKNA